MKAKLKVNNVFVEIEGEAPDVTNTVIHLTRSTQVGYINGEKGFGISISKDDLWSFRSKSEAE